MTDRYANIRKALAMGPTPGSREVFDLGMWDVEVRSSDTFGTICQVNNKGTLFHASEDGADRVGRSQDRLLSDAFFIAACDPDTIRELLAERDQLAAEIEALRAGAVSERNLKADAIHACALANIRAERLAEVLRRILDNEASDWKFAEEFGGYVLDDELREEARAALEQAACRE